MVLDQYRKSYHYSGNMKSSLNIAVVGAGLAGLTAAYELEKRGFSVTLFEARDRVGGRMKTVDLPKKMGTVEAGGTFIDVGHKAIRDLADELEVQIIKVGTNKRSFHYQWIDGELTTSEDNFKRFYPTIIKLEKDKLALENDSAFSDSLKNKKLSDYLMELAASSTFCQLLEMTSRNELAFDLSDLQASQIFEMISFDVKKEEFQINGSVGDEGFVLKRGSRELFDKIVSKLKEPINFAYTLTKIEASNGTGPLLTFINEGTEKVLSFDRVVLALPLPVLRDKIDLHIPGLPFSIKDVIENIPYGKNGKYIVYFDKAVWLSYPSGDKFNLICKDFWIWDNSDYLLGNNLYGLTGFSGGSAIDRFESLDDEEIVAEILSSLEQLVPDIRNHYIDFVRADQWHKNPNSMGSYEGRLFLGQTDPLIKAEEHSFGPISFTGASWNFEYCGFMNGAVEDGKQTAQAIYDTTQ
ncbi:MAG: monoamine oxidase [Halioglobus sp.]|jgi:monoamine oxidase